MSTGDQSEYIRGKAAVRGKAGMVSAPKFMRDGFDNFAAKTEVGVGGRMMDIQPPSGGRKNYKTIMGKYTGGAANPDSSKAIAKYSEELADKGLRIAIKMHKKQLAGEDYEAEAEAFNKAQQEWGNYVFSLPVELRKFASDGSADLASEAAELMNRVDKMEFDKRQKKRSGGRMMDIQPPSGGRSCGGRRGGAAVDDAINFVKSVAENPLVPQAGRDIAQKGVDFYNKAAPVAKAVREVLELPPMQKAIKKVLGDQTANTITSVTNFMKLIGLGKYSSDATFQKKVGASKSYKEYASGKYSGAAKIFEKLAPGRDVNTDVKKALQEQKKRLQQLKKQYAGSGLTGGKTFLETAAEWADRALKFYNNIAAKAPDFYDVLNAPATENLLKQIPGGPPSNTGKEIAKAIKFVFPNVGKGKGGAACCGDCEGSCRDCKKGSGILEDMGRAFGVPQAAQMEMKSIGPSQALGMVKGGRKPSAYAMFVKQFAAKNPGPNLMKRAGEAWRSQK
jgi:hypothetical protein